MFKREKRDLAISWLTLSAAFALVLGGFFNLFSFAQGFIISAVGVGTAFIFHELAHRQVAIKFGAQAEYRAWKTGLILTILLPLLTMGKFLFAAPGAVYIYGPNITRKENGIISAAGPVTNLVLGIIFFILTLLFPITSTGFSIGLVFLYGQIINFWLGLFNMLPIPPLDGSKIIRWDVRIWAVLLAALGFGVFAL